MKPGFKLDPVADQFCEVYGVKQLLEDCGLKKIRNSGDYLMALCPFHDNSREPDFQITKKNGLYLCFGCGAAGNLYTFVSQIHGISTKDANSFIQKLAGFDSSISVEDIKFRANLKNIFGLNKNGEEEKAESKAQFKITDSIIARMNTGPDPYNYLSSRGFTPETIAYFECTFTNKWRVYNQETDQYEFQERIVVPGHNIDGSLCGYIGRTPVNQTPKYRYTALYPKSTSLFNLHRVKNEISSTGVILVEGPLDAMQIHNLGIPYVCSIYGAKLHPAQIQLLCRYTNKVYLMFDNDKAGQNVMKESILSLNELLDVNIVSLDTYKDPGEILIRSELDRLLKSSLNFSTWKLMNAIT